MPDGGTALTSADLQRRNAAERQRRHRARQKLGIVHARDDNDVDAAASKLREAYQIGDARNVPDNPTIIDRITEK